MINYTQTYTWAIYLQKPLFLLAVVEWDEEQDEEGGSTDQQSGTNRLPSITIIQLSNAVAILQSFRTGIFFLKILLFQEKKMVVNTFYWEKNGHYGNTFIGVLLKPEKNVTISAPAPAQKPSSETLKLCHE